MKYKVKDKIFFPKESEMIWEIIAIGPYGYQLKYCTGAAHWYEKKDVEKNGIKVCKILEILYEI